MDPDHVVHARCSVVSLSQRNLRDRGTKLLSFLMELLMGMS